MRHINALSTQRIARMTLWTTRQSPCLSLDIRFFVRTRLMEAEQKPTFRESDYEITRPMDDESLPIKQSVYDE